MRPMYGLLSPDGKVVTTGSLLDLEEMFRNPESRFVEQTHFGKITVSTVFLGINHGWPRGYKDLWFETMIFGGDLSEYQERYETIEEARAGHAYAVKQAKRAWWIDRLQGWTLAAGVCTNTGASLGNITLGNYGYATMQAMIAIGFGVWILKRKRERK